VRGPTLVWRHMRACHKLFETLMCTLACCCCCRLLSCTYLGLVFGLVLYNTPADTLSGLRTRMNVCFTVVFLVALVPCMTISIYPKERKVYLADASAKLKWPWAYYVSKVSSRSACRSFCSSSLLQRLQRL
jgi:hypothetical protein